MDEEKPLINFDSYFDGVDTASEDLGKKKQNIYRLLVVTVVSAILFTAIMGYQLSELRKGDAEISTAYTALRTETPLLLLQVAAFKADSTSTGEFDRISLLINKWKQHHLNFLSLLRTLDYYADNQEVVELEVEKLNQSYATLERSMITFMSSQLGLGQAMICEVCVLGYLKNLEGVGNIVSQASIKQLNKKLAIALILLVTTALVFSYFFLFQMRPLFNQLLVKNKELRRISVKQSHIMRAPVANILGLLFLCDQASNMDELKKYLRLVKLNADAIDERIHQIVEASETVQDFDGKQKELERDIVISEEEIEMNLNK